MNTRKNNSQDSLTRAVFGLTITDGILLITLVITMFCATHVGAQTVVTPVGGSSVGGGGGGSSKNIALPFDSFASTNRAALASLAIRNVDHLMVTISDEADATLNSNNQERFVFPFTNSVKSFDAMVAMVMDNTFEFQVIDPSKPAYVSVSFTIGDPSVDYWYYNNQPFQTLLYGYNNGGTLQEGGKQGWYELNESSRHISMQLNYSIRMVQPGLIAGKAIHQQNGYAYSQGLNVDANTGQFDLPVDVVGSGTLVLFGLFEGKNQTIAISLVSGLRVPLSQVDIRLLLDGSPEVYTFNNPASISITQDSWQGYGINPLIIVKNPTVPTGGFGPLPITLQTTEGIIPTGYTVINIATGQVTHNTLPLGERTFVFPNDLGEYHIIPDLAVKGTNSGRKG